MGHTKTLSHAAKSRSLLLFSRECHKKTSRKKTTANHQQQQPNTFHRASSTGIQKMKLRSSRPGRGGTQSKTTYISRTHTNKYLPSHTRSLRHVQQGLPTGKRGPKDKKDKSCQHPPATKWQPPTVLPHTPNTPSPQPPMTKTLQKHRHPCAEATSHRQH